MHSANENVQISIKFSNFDPTTKKETLQRLHNLTKLSTRNGKSEANWGEAGCTNWARKFVACRLRRRGKRWRRAGNKPKCRVELCRSSKLGVDNHISSLVEKKLFHWRIGYMLNATLERPFFHFETNHASEFPIWFGSKMNLPISTMGGGAGDPSSDCGRC